jgi:hypothetical protein
VYLPVPGDERLFMDLFAYRDKVVGVFVRFRATASG